VRLLYDNPICHVVFRALELIPGLLNRLKIRAQDT
jgi:hypothetical protein